MSTIKSIVFLSVAYAMQAPPNTQGDNAEIQALEDMSGPELVKLHNLVASNMGMNRVNRFSNLETARERTWAVLELYDKETEAEQAEKPKADKPKKGKPKADAEPKKRRGPRFVFAPEKEVKAVREGTARAKALAVLSQKGGATFNDVRSVTGWNEKQAYEGIRLIHYYSGYGLDQTEGPFDPDKTKIWAYTKK